ALIDSVSGASSSLAADPNVRVVALFDNEEVGSTTAHGANSNLLASALKRLAFAELKDGPAVAESPATFEQALTRSLLISADMAHAVHPNYAEKHESNHRPAINKGIVIKQNAQQ
ncbi:hypothetical protein HK405_002745, partial [Cladochytrium tenue]